MADGRPMQEADPGPAPGRDDTGRRAGNALVELAVRLTRAGLSRARALGAALGVYLTMALALSVLALWGFAELASEVLEGDVDALDRSVLEWLHAHGAPWLDGVALKLTAFGSWPVLGLVSLAVTAFLVHLRERRYVVLVWAGAAGSLVLNETLKAAFGRTRPDVFEALEEVGSASFPSGHATNAMVFYTVLAWVIGHVVGPGALRAATYTVAALLVVMVGLTRVYLGVHYPSDVLAGFAVGYAWAILCAALVEGWARRGGGQT